MGNINYIERAGVTASFQAFISGLTGVSKGNIQVSFELTNSCTSRRRRSLLQALDDGTMFVNWSDDDTYDWVPVVIGISIAVFVCALISLIVIYRCCWMPRHRRGAFIISEEIELIDNGKVDEQNQQ